MRTPNVHNMGGEARGGEAGVVRPRLSPPNMTGRSTALEAEPAFSRRGVFDDRVFRRTQQSHGSRKNKTGND